MLENQKVLDSTQETDFSGTLASIDTEPIRSGIDQDSAHATIFKLSEHFIAEAQRQKSNLQNCTSAKTVIKFEAKTEATTSISSSLKCSSKDSLTSNINVDQQIKAYELKKNVIAAIACLDTLCLSQAPVSVELRARWSLAEIYRNWIFSFTEEELQLQKILVLLPNTQESSDFRMATQLRLVDLYILHQKTRFAETMLDGLISEAVRNDNAGALYNLSIKQFIFLQTFKRHNESISFLQKVINYAEERGDLDMLVYFRLEALQMYISTNNREMADSNLAFLYRVFNQSNKLIPISLTKQCQIKYHIFYTILCSTKGEMGLALTSAQSARAIVNEMVRDHSKNSNSGGDHHLKLIVNRGAKCCSQFSVEYNLKRLTPSSYTDKKIVQGQAQGSSKIQVTGHSCSFLEIWASMMFAFCMKNSYQSSSALKILNHCNNLVSDSEWKVSDASFLVTKAQLNIQRFYMYLQAGETEEAKSVLESVTAMSSSELIWSKLKDEIVMCHGLYLVRTLNVVEALETFKSVFSSAFKSQKYEIWVLSGLQIALISLGDIIEDADLATNIIQAILKRFSKELSPMPSRMVISGIQLIKGINTNEVVKSKAIILECLKFFIKAACVPLQAVALSFGSRYFKSTEPEEAVKMAEAAVSLSKYTKDPIYGRISKWSLLQLQPGLQAQPQEIESEMEMEMEQIQKQRQEQRQANVKAVEIKRIVLKFSKR